MIECGIKVHHFDVSVENLSRSTYSFRGAMKLLDETAPSMLLCVDAAQIASLLALKSVARRRGIPYIVVSSAIHPNCLKRFSPFLDEAIAGLQGAGAIVFLTEASRREFHSMLPNIRTPQFVIPYCCSNEYFQPSDPAIRPHLRATLGITDEELLCFTAARIEPQKGQMLLLKALKLLKDQGRIAGIRVVLAGRSNDVYLEQFKREIERLGLSRLVLILGERHDIPALLDASDLCVLPSYAEG
jgi:glycosyltransferase involved in cell wall biosynthesis